MSGCLVSHVWVFSRAVNKLFNIHTQCCTSYHVKIIPTPSLSILPKLYLVVIGRLVLEKCDIIWMDDGIIYKQRKDLSSFLVLKMGEALGKGTSFSGICLRRGYRESAMADEEEPAPVGHLILMVHGIGESLDRSPISKSTTECVHVDERG